MNHPNAPRPFVNYASPSSFDDVLSWLDSCVGLPLNVLLSSADGSVLAFLRGTLSDAEELQRPPIGPRRVAFGVGDEDNFFVLDEEAFDHVESVGMMTLVLATSSTRASLEVESVEP